MGILGRAVADHAVVEQTQHGVLSRAVHLPIHSGRLTDLWRTPSSLLQPEGEVQWSVPYSSGDAKVKSAYRPTTALPDRAGIATVLLPALECEVSRVGRPLF